jgi:hypothetical protein
MGLVQSQSSKPEDAVEVDGLFFTVEKNLRRFVPIYGNLLVDFKKTFFGSEFTVNFGRQGCC